MSIISRKSMLGKLKVELKGALRSRMNATINAVCVDFEEHVDLSSSRPAATVEDAEFDRYFDYCRRLVQYIAKTMDTSPNFVEKMDSIILASRNDAPKKMLDAVVKQDVWFHRHSDVHSEKKMGTEDTTNSPLQILGKRKPTQTKPPSKRCRVDSISASQDTDDANLSEEGTSVFELLQKENHESGDDQEGENDESESNVMENQESEKETITAVDADKVGDRCLLKPQYPGQLEAIKAWIHDVNNLIDAQCCTPPTGYACSRSCAEIMKKRNNKSNLHRTWQCRSSSRRMPQPAMRAEDSSRTAPNDAFDRS